MGILRRGLWRVRRDSHLPFFCSGYFAAFAFFSNFRAAELMQNLWPVGFRPSSKTCLGCASADGFGSRHTVALVVLQLDFIGRDRLVAAGPARTGVIFCVGGGSPQQTHL